MVVKVFESQITNQLSASIVRAMLIILNFKGPSLPSQAGIEVLAAKMVQAALLCSTLLTVSFANGRMARRYRTWASESMKMPGCLLHEDRALLLTKIAG